MSDELSTPTKIDRHTIETGIAVGALIVSLLAAGFAWQQVEVSRVHNMKSVAPILQITPYAEGIGRRNGIYLTNDGLGPGIIKHFAIRSIGGEAQGLGVDRWAEVLGSAGIDPRCFAAGWPREGAAIKAGLETGLLTLTTAPNLEAPCLLQVIKLVDAVDIEVEVTYESVYGESRTAKASSRIRRSP